MPGPSTSTLCHHSHKWRIAMGSGADHQCGAQDDAERTSSGGRRLRRVAWSDGLEGFSTVNWK